MLVAIEGTITIPSYMTLGEFEEKFYKFLEDNECEFTGDIEEDE